MRPIQNNRFLLIFTAAILVMLLHAWSYYPFTADDAFISYRYVDRFLEGKGLTWTDGKPVEGYSNLLWILLLALLKTITHAELWIIALFTGLACSILSLWLAMKVARRVTHGDTAAVAWTAGIFVLAAPVAIWINGGLEAPLVMLLLIAAVNEILRPEPATKNIIIAGLFLGLLALTRPDGILFAWAITAAWLVQHYLDHNADTQRSFRQRAGTIIGRSWKPLVLLNIIVAAFFVAQLTWRLKTYGEWVPNTALVKIGFTKKRMGEGLIYVAKMLFVYFPFILVFLLLARKIARKILAALLFILVVIAIESFYLAGIGGDIFPGYRHVLPLVPLLCIFSAIVISSLLARSNAFKNSWVYAVGFVVICAVIYFAQAKTYNNYSAKIERWEWNAKAIGSTLDSAFGKAQPMIATSAAGALPYYSKLPSLDILGLNDYYLPRHPPKDFGSGMLAHELGDADYYLQVKPDIFFFYGLGYAQPYFRAEKDLYDRLEFKSAYQQVKLKYGMQYILPFPYYDRRLQPAIKLYDLSYIYIRRLSDRIGVRSVDSNTLIIPSYFVRNAAMPDSAATVTLSDGKSLVTRLVPSETYFIPKTLMDSVFHGTMPPVNIQSNTIGGDSLTTMINNGVIELRNPGKNPVELREIRLHLQ